MCDKLFEAELNRIWTIGLCHTCGNTLEDTTTKLCTVCGAGFCHHNHTLLTAMYIASKTGFIGGNQLAVPVVAYRLQIVLAGRVAEFIEYTNARLAGLDESM